MTAWRRAFITIQSANYHTHSRRLMLYIYTSRWILPQSSAQGRHGLCRDPRRITPARPLFEWRSPVPADSPARNCFGGWRDTRACASPPRCRRLPDGPARSLPALAKIWDGVIEPFSAGKLAEEADVVFLALPEEAAATIAPALVERGVRVIDLSGAFRLRDAAQRVRNGIRRPGSGRSTPVYGLTERNYGAIRGAQLVTNPGCYPTAALLALEPLAEAGLLAGDVVIDAKSGISGAGKKATDRTHFSENHGSVSAYGVFGHRHQPEIEQELGDACDVRASPGASRSRHPRNDLCARAAGHDVARCVRRHECGIPQLHLSCASPVRRCRRSSTRRIRISATSAGAWIRRAVGSCWSRSSTIW